MKFLLLRLWVFTLLALIVACSTPPELKPSATPERPVVDPVVEKSQRITDLLVSAQRAFNKDHLMAPLPGSAFSLYQQVLVLDEVNAEAHWGMHQVTARYMELAEQAFVVGNRSKATLMLERALAIAAKPADVERLKAKYPPRPAAENEFPFVVRDLSARNDRAVVFLTELAEKARALQSRITIVARTDAEGRWIYQQMREAVVGYRLRGNIEVGSMPRIVLIDWVDT
jgi:hypothetical protein